MKIGDRITYFGNVVERFSKLGIKLIKESEYNKLCAPYFHPETKIYVFRSEFHLNNFPAIKYGKIIKPKKNIG